MLNQKEINDLIATCRKSGRKILRFYGCSQIDYKETGPVTQADIASNQIITEALQKYNLPIISEEMHSEKNACLHDKYWLVDPLDGTKEFINNTNDFTVNIALIENKKPVFGIVFAPVHKTIWIGINNKNNKKSYRLNDKGEEKIIFCRKPNLKKLVSLISNSHADSSKLKLFYERNRLNIIKEISMGSSLKICMIAEGNADIYPRLGQTMEWDTAAAQAVLEGAGGYLLTNNGKALYYGKDKLKNTSFVATNFKNNFSL